MGAGLAGSEHCHQPVLKIFGDAVFQLFGFIVNLEPFHAEYLGEHPFDQMMTFEQPFGNAATGLRQEDPPFASDPDQTVPFEALDRGGYSGRGYLQPPGESSRNDDFAL